MYCLTIFSSAADIFSGAYLMRSRPLSIRLCVCLSIINLFIARLKNGVLCHDNVRVLDFFQHALSRHVEFDFHRNWVTLTYFTTKSESNSFLAIMAS